jgi:hypothetical protein
MVGSWRWQNTKKIKLIGQLGRDLFEREGDHRMSDLCDKTAVELRRLIGRKDISPVELLESCITRIEATDGAVNAVVTRAFDRARKEALHAEKTVLDGEELGLLHGLPLASRILRRQMAFGPHLVQSSIPIIYRTRIKDQLPISAPRAASLLARPTRQNLAQALTHAILSLARPEPLCARKNLWWLIWRLSSCTCHWHDATC